jgi:hypothetical protein
MGYCITASEAPRRCVRSRFCPINQWDKVHDFSSSSNLVKFIHTLLTPTVFTPCPRLESRNRPEHRQEKSAILFFRAFKKTLTEKSISRVRKISLAAPSCAFDLAAVRENIAASFASQHAPSNSKISPI